jgi:hypothetical protein
MLTTFQFRLSIPLPPLLTTKHYARKNVNFGMWLQNLSPVTDEEEDTKNMFGARKEERK